MLFWLPSSSCGGFLSNSYRKLMPNALLATLLRLWWFLIEFLLKTDAKCFSDCTHRLWWFLIEFSLKTDAKWSSGYPYPLVVVSHSILIEN
jgi:hypothetical protein